MGKNWTGTNTDADGSGLDIHWGRARIVLHDRLFSGIRRAREAGVGHGRHGEDAWKEKWKMLAWRGWLQARKLKTGMCGGCLSVAYTLTGVRGNDDDSNLSKVWKSLDHLEDTIEEKSGRCKQIIKWLNSLRQEILDAFSALCHL